MRNIERGEELFFDYGFNQEKYDQLSWMETFIKKYFPWNSKSKDSKVKQISQEQEDSD
jgi:hypothetical protein